MALREADRLREEDPFTGEFTVVAPTRIVVQRSRFEADLNRPRQRAVYLRSEDAWGLPLWRSEPDDGLVARSLEIYDDFYEMVGAILDDLVAEQGRFVLLDLHSYNHRRDGANEPAAPERDNPEINVGTGTLDRDRWGRIVDRFMGDLAAHDYLGGHLDVRENVRFRGGNLARWVHERYPHTGCALAIEVKKIFMDEWSGKPFLEAVEAIVGALKASIPGILEELAAM